MDTSIREAIIENFKALPNNEIYQTIEEATTSNEEKTLPGLGVFFELIWRYASNSFKTELANQIAVALSKEI